VTSFRTVALAVFAAALLAGCGNGAAKHARTAPSPNPIPTAAAKESTVKATATISGVIAPFQNVAITSSLSEPVDSVNVLEGDHVRAGQVIAVLDTADLRAQLAQAQANVQSAIRNAESSDAKVSQARYTQTLNIGQGDQSVRSAQAALASAQSTLRNDTANLERDRALLGSGYIAQQTFDQQQTLVTTDESSLRTAQANLQSATINAQVNGTASTGLQAANVAAAIADANSARAAVAQARAQVQQYAVSIAKARITAPVDGVVVNRNLNPGEYPGSRTIFTIQQLDRVYAMLNASSSDTFSIPVGAHVTLSIAGNSARTYTGDVVAVLGQVTPGSTDFTVEVLIDNADGKLQSGLPVTATAALPAVSGVGIPTAAFLDDTHTTIMVADDELVDVVAKTVKVHELASDGTTSIVSGIKAGQKIVANGQLGVSDGQSLAQN
jgi:RND family efflux transporter MFP subunit